MGLGYRRRPLSLAIGRRRTSDPIRASPLPKRGLSRSDRDLVLVDRFTDIVSNRLPPAYAANRARQYLAAASASLIVAGREP